MRLRHVRLVIAGALALACGAGACGEDREERTVVVGVQMHGLDSERLRISPGGAVRVVHAAHGGLELGLDAGELPATLALEHPEACTVQVSLGGGAATGRVEADLVPLVDLGPDLPQVGFDAPFTIEARPGCDEAHAGEIRWRVVSGGEVRDFAVEDRGLVVRGRTRALGELHPEPLPWGIVPLSPRTRGEHVLEATLELDGRAPIRRRVRVAAAARATGVPTVALSHRVLLGGAGWHVVEAPPRARAALDAAEDHALLVPDVPGRWTLSDALGRTLVVSANRHDALPLDCGRSECHAGATEAAASSPMTRVLEHGLDGRFADYEPACAIACHAAGEPGIDDGGFTHVARDLGVMLPRRGAEGSWARLPRALRRLGGVGCTSCHGPAAIPEPEASFRILRNDVCAVCHDAPPRYGHVAALASSRMARADATPGVRDDPACARCHTTAGFLDAIGVRPAQRSARTSEEESIAETSAERGRRGDRVPPPDVGLAGIACAACHAAHGEDVGRALVRRVRRPELLVSAAVLDAAPVTGICLPCHTPDDGDAPPQASAAALWLGRGGSRIAGGEPLDGEAPHASVADGCIGCHAAPRPGLEVERGAGHAFGVDRAACARCHATEPSERAARGASIEGRARRVAEELAARGLLPAPGAFPAHASARANDTALLDPAAARAVRNALLVLEDPAAAEHNAPYARALLDEVERWLATP